MPQADWKFFRSALLDWYRPERRPMPWKADRDPYRIWLSEIILQQTRVAQGLPYFEKFVTAYPTVTDLAAAADDAVMKLWEGLGYYSRARNLLRAARVVANDLGGRFPDTYAGLLALPGVGPYTAAAIASFAFDRHVAVLDGNVFRILARYAADATPIDTGPGKKHFQQLAEAALGASGSAARFNQAIMDFGALVCTPRNPACNHCPLAPGCQSRLAGAERVFDFPVKAKKLRKRTRYFHYLIVRDGNGRILIRQRKEKDIWEGLYEPPLLETPEPQLPVGDLALHPRWPERLPAAELAFLRSSPPYRQQLTHQTILAVFHTFHWPRMPESVPGFLSVNNKMLDDFALPRLLTRYFTDKSLLLDLF